MTQLKETPVPLIAERLGLEVHRNKTSCPKCGSSQTPALHLYEDHFYCYSCGFRGDSLELVKKVLNCSFQDAYKFILGEELPQNRVGECSPESMVFQIPVGTNIEYEETKNCFVEKPKFKKVTGLNKALKLFRELQNQQLKTEIVDQLKNAFERTGDITFFEKLLEWFPNKERIVMNPSPDRGVVRQGV